MQTLAPFSNGVSSSSSESADPEAPTDDDDEMDVQVGVGDDDKEVEASVGVADDDKVDVQVEGDEEVGGDEVGGAEVGGDDEASVGIDVDDDDEDKEEEETNVDADDVMGILMGEVDRGGYRDDSAVRVLMAGNNERRDNGFVGKLDTLVSGSRSVSDEGVERVVPVRSGVKNDREVRCTGDE